MRPPETYSDPRAYADYFHTDESPAFRAAIAAGLTRARNTIQKPVQVAVVDSRHVGFRGHNQLWR